MGNALICKVEEFSLLEQSAETRLSQYYECLVVGTLNLLALQFQTLTRLLEASISSSASASSSSSTAETTTGAVPGSTSSSGATTAEQQQQQTQTHAQVWQLVADPKFHALLASYANLLFALGTPVPEYRSTITSKCTCALRNHCVACAFVA